MYRQILKKLFWGGLHKILSDRQYAKFRYWLDIGRKLNLENPRAFTEKIQFLKLYNRNELRRIAADRIRVRDYVKEKLGSEYLIPTYLETEKITRNDWNRLPDQFVLKANHGCGMVELVMDKSSVDFRSIQEIIKDWQAFDYAKFGREWVYKNLPRRIIAEELILNRNDEIPRDYKLFCFNGSAEIIQVDIGRFDDQRRNLYDRDFNRLEATALYSNTASPVGKPENLHEMISVAETLSADFNFIRVDLYSVNDQIYFGELTNFPGNGFIPFQPDSFDFELGKKLAL